MRNTECGCSVEPVARSLRMRYFTFKNRIEVIGRYLLKVEEDAFGPENGAKLPGFVRFSQNHGLSRATLLGTGILWLILICCSFALSCILFFE